MAKIGRNDPCPCGSGKKYKKCCQDRQQMPITPQAANQGQPTLSLRHEVEKTQQAAVDRRNTLRTLGVFIFFTTDAGDGWLLEISEMDALQVARGGEKIEVEIDEGNDTIEVNWSHRFRIANKLFTTIDYKDKSTATYPDYPNHRIAKMVKKARSQFPPEMLRQVHIADEENE